MELLPSVMSRLRAPMEYRRGSVPTPMGRTSTEDLTGRSCSHRSLMSAHSDSCSTVQRQSSPQLSDGQESPASRGENIRVAVRVRPLPSGEEGIIEVAGCGAIAIRKDAATGGNEFLRSQQGRVEERMFDHVFGPEATQREVYSWSASPLVTEAVAKARSATIFVYGATGAGKTHTMFGSGDREHQGLIFRAIPEVFEAVRNLEGLDGHMEIKVSFLEIYNENLRDLLQEGGGGGACKVLEDEKKGIVKVTNLTEAVVRSPEEALWCLKAGMQTRTVEATAANAQSSRAHAVFTLTLEHVRYSQGAGPFRRSQQEHRSLHSKISLIDLAGSERAAFTQNSGSSLKDGARINQSLLALANCIDALTAKGRDGGVTPRKKPPYRDSKLTLMLKASLTGDGLVAMIANVHPGRRHFEDSNNTLEYAKRASAVRCAPRRLSRPAPTPDECAASGMRTPAGMSVGSLSLQDFGDEDLDSWQEEAAPHAGRRCAESPPGLRTGSKHHQLRRRRRGLNGTPKKGLVADAAAAAALACRDLEDAHASRKEGGRRSLSKVAALANRELAEVSSPEEHSGVSEKQFTVAHKGELTDGTTATGPEDASFQECPSEISLSPELSAAEAASDAGSSSSCSSAEMPILEQASLPRKPLLEPGEECPDASVVPRAPRPRDSVSGILESTAPTSCDKEELLRIIIRQASDNEWMLAKLASERAERGALEAQRANWEAQRAADLEELARYRACNGDLEQQLARCQAAQIDLERQLALALRMASD